jgi:ribosomal protein S18 acetylase RimI-like enzyme
LGFGSLSDTSHLEARMGGINGIRRATLEDAALLADLGTRLFEQTFGEMNDAEDMQDYLASAFSPDIQKAEIADPDRATFLAFDDSETAIGYAMARRGSRSNGVVAERPVEVQRIYVDRTLHGTGLGAALMAACVDQARAWNGEVLWLGVWQENPRAIAFYKRTGFVVVGEQEFMVGRDVQHDFVMARPLG